MVSQNQAVKDSKKKTPAKPFWLWQRSPEEHRKVGLGMLGIAVIVAILPVIPHPAHNVIWFEIAAPLYASAGLYLLLRAKRLARH